MADLIGDYLFTYKAFVESLSREHRNVFQKIFDEIKYLCKVATAGSKEARQLEKVKKVFQEAYRAEIKKPTEGGGVKYSLMAFEKDGRRFVEIDQDQDRFDGHSADEYPAIAKEIIKEKFENRVIGIDNNMFVNGAGRSEFAYPSKPIKEADIYEAKMRASAELDNLLDAGENFRNKPDGEDGHIHPDAIGGFDYFDTLFKIGKRYFEGRINIKNIKRGKLFTDVTQIKDVTQAIMSSYGSNPKSQFLRTSSMNSIRNPRGNVNNPNSLSAQGQAENGGKGWQVRGQDVALEQEQTELPLPLGYRDGNTVAGATQKGSKPAPADRENSFPMPEDAARVEAQEDGVFPLPEDIAMLEQRQMDAEFRERMGEDPVLYDTDGDEGVETTQDRLEVKRDNLQWELKENQRLKDSTLTAMDQQIADLQEKFDAKKHKQSKNSQALLRRIQRLKRQSTISGLLCLETFKCFYT